LDRNVIDEEQWELIIEFLFYLGMALANQDKERATTAIHSYSYIMIMKTVVAVLLHHHVTVTVS
jgi:hypothetical protein